MNVHTVCIDATVFSQCSANEVLKDDDLRRRWEMFRHIARSTQPHDTSLAMMLVTTADALPSLEAFVRTVDHVCRLHIAVVESSPVAFLAYLHHHYSRCDVHIVSAMPLSERSPMRYVFSCFPLHRLPQGDTIVAITHDVSLFLQAPCEPEQWCRCHSTNARYYELVDGTFRISSYKPHSIVDLSLLKPTKYDDIAQTVSLNRRIVNCDQFVRTPYQELCNLA